MRRAIGAGIAALSIACGGAAPQASAPPVAEVSIARDAGAPTDASAMVAVAPMAASEEDAAVPIAADDATWGERNAPVTIVEFGDFQCPFTNRASATIEELEHRYGPSQLRVVWKNEPLPFHPQARDAAEVAIGVRALGGDPAFWKFHELAFANQKDIGRDAMLRWASGAGVDPAALADGLATHAWGPKIDRDHATAKKVGVNGTPFFLINGVRLGGAQPVDKFIAIVDAQLAHANVLAANGVPRDRVYAVAAAENATAWAEEDRRDSDKQRDADTKTYKVPVGSSPVRGKRDALITIVEFGDFECPFTKRVQATLDQLRTKYGDDLRIVWKHEPLPFHAASRPASELALEARAQKGDAAFWATHDAIFAAAPKLESADLEAIARAQKLDVPRVKAALAQKRHASLIAEDEDLADDVQANGTPHFFVNGRRLVGAQPLEKFEPMIDEALARARELVAKGVRRDRVYDEIEKDAVAAHEPEKKTVASLASAPRRGAAAPKVTVIEFGDFQCTFCKRVQDTLGELLKDEPAVAIEWRNLPLPMHADAALAAEAAMEAFAQKGRAGFWKMHDLLYANQGALKRADLDAYAAQAGLDVARFDAALDAHAHQAAIDADASAAHVAGINGTPGFVINGYFLNGAQPLAKFRRLVRRALAEAKRGNK